jgi:hypothetical protein
MDQLFRIRQNLCQVWLILTFPVDLRGQRADIRSTVSTHLQSFKHNLPIHPFSQPMLEIKPRLWSNSGIARRGSPRRLTISRIRQLEAYQYIARAAEMRAIIGTLILFVYSLTSFRKIRGRRCKFQDWEHSTRQATCSLE